MTSRERVLTALNHEEPDRVPIDLGGTVVSSIAKVFPPYVVAFVMLVVIVLVSSVVQALIELLIPAFIAFLICETLSLYLLIVEGRILGLIYYTNADALGFSVHDD